MMCSGWPKSSDDSNRVARWLAWKLLRVAEWLLLYVYGWRRCAGEALTSRNAWYTPEQHPKNRDNRFYDHDHALNSTKFYACERTPEGRDGMRVRRRGGR